MILRKNKKMMTTINNLFGQFLHLQIDINNTRIMEKSIFVEVVSDQSASENALGYVNTEVNYFSKFNNYNENFLSP